MALESRFNVSTFQYIISYKETRFEATENLIVLSFAISKNCKILLTFQNVFLFYQNKDMIDTFCGYECFSKNLDMALENCRRNHKLPQKLCKIVRKSQLKWQNINIIANIFFKISYKTQFLIQIFKERESWIIVSFKGKNYLPVNKAYIACSLSLSLLFLLVRNDYLHYPIHNELHSVRCFPSMKCSKSLK